MSGQVTTTETVLQTLVKKLARPVEIASQRRAASHVLDWLGSAALGAKSTSATGFVNVTAKSPVGPCRALGAGRRDWWSALQLNAALGNLLEMDDLHRSSILHPGPVIIPAAIATAEMANATASQLLSAIVRGYEATIRIGRALGPSHYAFFHNTSTAGVFGAAAAAADLLGLNAQQTAWALGNAGSRTGGLWQMRHEACETKSLHNAQAAQTGVQAALLAADGVRGPLSLLEGPQGLFAAMAPESDSGMVMYGADRGWLIHEVSFKPWPACRHAHPTIDAALAVHKKMRRETPGADIAAIEITTYRSAIDFCNQPVPQTEHQAKFSLQHCAAVVLAHGAPWLPQFSPARLQLPEIIALRNKVVVREGADFSARFPNHYGANVRVIFSDGRVVEHEQRDALGDPELPLSDSEIINKARLLLTEAGARNVDGLILSTMALASGGKIEEFSGAWP